MCSWRNNVSFNFQQVFRQTFNHQSPTKYKCMLMNHGRWLENYKRWKKTYFRFATWDSEQWPRDGKPYEATNWAIQPISGWWRSLYNRFLSGKPQYDTPYNQEAHVQFSFDKTYKATGMEFQENVAVNWINPFLAKKAKKNKKCSFPKSINVLEFSQLYSLKAVVSDNFICW